MKAEQKIIAWFQELIEQAETLMQGRNVVEQEPVYNRSPLLAREQMRQQMRQGSIPTTRIQTVDREQITQWGMSSLYSLERTFGKERDHYIKFNEQFKLFDLSNNYDSVRLALSILRAAKVDCEHSYLFDTRVLIEAEVFGDFLEQAEHLFSQGYYQPAAVIAGGVLEDGLRKLCDRKGVVLLPKPKLDSMNSDLAKAGIYNKLRQKRITALADIRNSAAHGKWTEFGEKDVEEMIRDVRRFMEDHFS